MRDTNWNQTRLVGCRAEMWHVLQVIVGMDGVRGGDVWTAMWAWAGS